MVKNLSIVLAGMSLETGKVIKKVSILAGQLEEIFLFLIIIREEEATIILKIGYIICRLVIPRV
jgi:hypothetical protein